MGSINNVDGRASPVAQADVAGSGQGPDQNINPNQKNSNDPGLSADVERLLSRKFTAQLFSDSVPVARDPSSLERGLSQGPRDDIRLSQDAKEVLDLARETIQLARGFVRDTIAGAIAKSAGDFLEQLGVIAGNPVRPEEELPGLARKIAETATDQAEELSQSLFDETGGEDFSFKEIKLSVVVETFDLRVATGEHTADVQMKRIRLRVEIEEVGGDLHGRDSRTIDLDPAEPALKLPEPGEAPAGPDRTGAAEDLLRPEEFDPLAETLDSNRSDLRSVLDRLKEEHTGLNQDFMESVTQSLGDLFDRLLGGPVSTRDGERGLVSVRPELALYVRGGDGEAREGLRGLPDLRPGGVRDLGA